MHSMMIIRPQKSLIFRRRRAEITCQARARVVHCRTSRLDLSYIVSLEPAQPEWRNDWRYEYHRMADSYCSERTLLGRSAQRFLRTQRTNGNRWEHCETRASYEDISLLHDGKACSPRLPPVLPTARPLQHRWEGCERRGYRCLMRIRAGGHSHREDLIQCSPIRCSQSRHSWLPQ